MASGQNIDDQHIARMAMQQKLENDDKDEGDDEDLDPNDIQPAHAQATGSILDNWDEYNDEGL
jgi:hypothetical protein